MTFVTLLCVATCSFRQKCNQLLCSDKKFDLPVLLFVLLAQVNLVDLEIPERRKE